MPVLIGFGVLVGAAAALFLVLMLCFWLHEHPAALLAVLVPMFVLLAWLIGSGITSKTGEPHVPMFIWIPGAIGFVLFFLTVAASD